MGFPSKSHGGCDPRGVPLGGLSTLCPPGTALHREEGPEPVLSGEEAERYTQGPGSWGRGQGLAKLSDREGVVWC